MFESIKLEEDVKIDKILLEFSNEWKISYNRTVTGAYTIKFKSFKQFDKFRKYALKLAKPYNVFEGDVMDMVNQYNLVDTIVELKLGSIFDITSTLAKILDLREI